MAAMVTAAQAGTILSGWPNYSLVQQHWRAGRLRQVYRSDRVRLYFRSQVLKLLAKQNEAGAPTQDPPTTGKGRA